MRAEVVAALFVLVGCYANARSARSSRSLPDALAPVLAKIKAGTGIPILLPTALPTPFVDAKHAVLEKATPHQYGIALYYELGVGNAGFAASFEGKNNAAYSPRELPNVREVRLANDVVGFFRPVSCGGSCAPANIWWEQGKALYQIQLKLSPSLPENEQQRIISEVASSAIRAGPR